MTRELLSEVLGSDIYLKQDAYDGYMENVNIYELAFDKCIEWLWKQGFELWSFRANNIFHVRISNKDIEEKRFYSNPDDKHEAVFQAAQWVLDNKND